MDCYSNSLEHSPFFLASLILGAYFSCANKGIVVLRNRRTFETTRWRMEFSNLLKETRFGVIADPYKAMIWEEIFRKARELQIEYPLCEVLGTEVSWIFSDFRIFGYI